VKGKPRAPKPPKPLTEYQIQEIAAIESGDTSAMTFGRLSQLRNFAHWPIPQRPELLNVWRERGEPYFQRLQTERLDAYYAERMATQGY
jgi:hypothetical protein